MNELIDQSLHQIMRALLVGDFLLLVIALVIWEATWRRNAKRHSGLFCTQCGMSVSGNPSRAIVTPDKNYYVYACTRCKGETITTHPPSDG